MPFALSRLERLYLTLESTFGQAVAPSGSNYCRHIKVSMNNRVALLNRRDKTGTRSVLKGKRGRSVGSWSYEGSLVAGGGVDADVLFQMLFGAGSGGSYTLADTIHTGNLWSYKTPSTLNHKAAIGAVLQNATFTLGQDIAEWQCDGQCLGVLGSNFFGAADTTQKGGLGSFPAEPGSPVSHGDIIAGFTGAITIDGVTLATLRTATIKVNTGNALVTDSFGTFYASQAEGDERVVTLAFNVYEDDSSGQETLIEVADAKTPVDATIQVGVESGNVFTFTVKGVQLESPTSDDGQRRFVTSYGDSRAHASALSAKDELALTIS